MGKKRELTVEEVPETEGDPSEPSSPTEPKRKKAREVAPALAWAATWFMPEGQDWDEQRIEQLKKRPEIAGAIIGREICPDTGRKHFQMYIEFDKKRRPFSLELPKDIHWESARKSGNTNHKYCTKEDDTAAIWGTCKKYVPYQVKLTLRDWQQELFEILETEPDDRTIYWIWEPWGGVGKSKFCKWLVVMHPELNTIVTGGKSADVMHQVCELHKAGNLPRRIILDVPRSKTSEFICFQAIESLKNMCFFSGKYEGGMVTGPEPHIVIFANEYPPIEKLSADRWKIARIDNDKLVWRQ